MKIISNIKEMRQIIKLEHQKNNNIGLVPTMGNLHQGHISLIKKIKFYANIVVTSIFINPLQFDKIKDFNFYPKTLKSDLNKLKEMKCNYVFTPTFQEMYSNNKLKNSININLLNNILCAKSRPQHLTGVATIILKLFNIIMPNYVVFGLKDYQQFLMIKQLIKYFCFPIKIISAPTVRNKEGLALSSRNYHLSNKELKIAPRLNKILNIIKTSILNGESNFREIEKQTILIINDSGFTVDYFEIRRQEDLKLAVINDNKIIIFIAAYLGKIRLIDNIIFQLN